MPYIDWVDVIIRLTSHLVSQKPWYRRAAKELSDCLMMIYHGESGYTVDVWISESEVEDLSDSFFRLIQYHESIAREVHIDDDISRPMYDFIIQNCIYMNLEDIDRMSEKADILHQEVHKRLHRGEDIVEWASQFCEGRRTCIPLDSEDILDRSRWIGDTIHSICLREIAEDLADVFDSAARYNINI